MGHPHDPAATPAPGSVLLCARRGPPALWWRFTAPEAVLEATRPGEVRAVLREAEVATDAGLFAVGFLAYEAAPAFDAALAVRADCPLPLARFGLYRSPQEVPPPPPPPDGGLSLRWCPAGTRARYVAAVARIRRYIAAGDTYQVNYTQRLRTAPVPEPWSLFRAMAAAQPHAYAAYLDCGRHVICSASPELFFRLEGERVTARPMKGTAPRGLTAEDDRFRAAALAASEKDRAENLMILDMVRNDLGRIARTGTVRVPARFSIERYDTLWQMTSTVTARTVAPPGEIFAALFPCASITGAPKVRAMQIIAELEPHPRGIYCGAIGFLAPGRRARFSVAIRTVHLDRARAAAEYGTGGGIVWDSTPAAEWEECRTKALVLTAAVPAFSLLETLRWQPGYGYVLLRRHLDRLRGSAAYFGFAVDLRDVRRRLARLAADFPRQPQRVRLLLARDGDVRLEAGALPAAPTHPWRVCLAAAPVDPGDRFLYHKTTRRAVYEAARAARPGYDDVLLWNARGEITESTIANVAVRIGRHWVTPPAACGLLPGTFRAELLARGRLREGIVTRDSLVRASAVCLLNSVRGRIPVRLDPPGGDEGCASNR